FHQKSGLRRAIDLLEHLEGIEAIYLDAEDVVRHRLVKEIIRAYERSDEEMRHRNKPRDKDEKERSENGVTPAPPQDPFPWQGIVQDEEE
ncbi:MAG TPA: PhoH family protein, partial [Saprospiraceae bacterium]|nr:PhoH family protein [Saprospiraceae bacterium]